MARSFILRRGPEHWTNIQTREHGFKKKNQEHSNIRTLNIRTFEHLQISDQLNIEHFNVQKSANIAEHSNMIHVT